ncbi:chemokine (C motif) receptor 1a, duplicate 1 isoform X1 [Echeneis naucrates]|uniref:chemokine (C motif) receptor 1a, duplicate 1 isoform X1 n=1 Tax=Echeneis naucrates TaxID=173247 RepID=UPI001113DCAD|nr:uncharacterized protein LOC115042038 isoform X1 [Echeneis naucrates]
MQMWILVCLYFILSVHGYYKAPFLESCGTMSPVHLNRLAHPISAQTSTPPYELDYIPGNKGEPITVILRSKTHDTFMGFMLEARETGMVNEGPPVGRFITLDPSQTVLMACSGLPDSAVGQTNNLRKSIVHVNWTSEGQELQITFRATFVKYYETFWEGVDIDVLSPTQPTTAASTAPTTTASTAPSTAASTAPTTAASTEPSAAASTEPTTATSTEPSAAASTEPSTAASTEPSAAASMAPSAAASTEPSTAASTEPSTASSITDQTIAGIIPISIYQKVVPILTCVSISIKVVQMELANTVNILSQFPFYLNKGLKMTLSAFCAVLEIMAVTILFVEGLHDVIIAVLLFVAIGINIIELMINCLPFKPSHELYKISDVAAKVCCAIHQIFAFAVIFAAVLVGNRCRPHEGWSWLLKVIVAYTAWILLCALWVCVFSIHGKKILGSKIEGCKIVANKTWHQGKREKLQSGDMAVIAVSAIIMTGALAFTLLITIGMFGC